MANLATTHRALERVVQALRSPISIAVFAAALLPMSAPAAAAVIMSTGSTVSITTTTGGTPGNYFITYEVYDTSTVGGDAILEIDIPELNSGDLNFAAGLPEGWDATEFRDAAERRGSL